MEKYYVYIEETDSLTDETLNKERKCLNGTQLCKEIGKLVMNEQENLYIHHYVGDLMQMSMQVMRQDIKGRFRLININIRIREEG